MSTSSRALLSGPSVARSRFSDESLLNALSCSLAEPQYPVDDQAACVTALEKRLTKRGMDVLGTGSGEETLQKLKEETVVDVVVPDLKMPRMLGIEFLNEIKKLNPLISVIVLTVYGLVDTAVDGMKTGAFDYVTRSCQLDELTEKIKRTRDK